MGRKPSPAELLTEHYRGLDRGELRRQGEAHLRGRADRQVLGVRRRLWQMAGLLLLLVVAGTAILCWRALATARAAGAGFAEARAEVLQAYGVGGD